SAAAAAVEQQTPDVVLTDLRMPGESGLDLLEQLGTQRPDLPVIVMTAFSDLDTSVQAHARGAFDYLPKPFDIDDVIQCVDRALDAHGPLGSPEASVDTVMVGESPAMQQLFRVIGRLSRSRFNVLVTGETGTGKELVAQALHRHSPLRDGPFVALNTAAIPSELLESELFGHEKGAFTGAQQAHVGRFEQANGGTLFLDEIGDMPAALQTRLLRVLAEGEFYRVGGRELRRVEVRVVAATHQDLEQRVRDGLFREDLFHRLNVVQIRVPPLRERGGDVVRLAQYFLEAAARESGLERKRLSADAEAALHAHRWPGNVRELENLCRRLTVLSPGTTIRGGDIRAPAEAGVDVERADGRPAWARAAAAWAEAELAAGHDDLMAEATDLLQAALFESALDTCANRKGEAALRLGVGRNTLTRRLKALRQSGYEL
ncbi:MAG: nitrogen regulation protein NR(I), partial [Pseudomonadota bacterium]